MPKHQDKENDKTVTRRPASSPLFGSSSFSENINHGELLSLLVEVSEHISEAMVVYDSEGRLVACNRNFCDMYGYTEEEAAPGVHFRDLGKIDIERGNVAVGDEYGSGEDYLKRKAEYREKLEGSFIVRLKDGRWIKTTDRRLPSGGFVSVQTDISNEKMAEENLRLAKERAERALADNAALSGELADKVELLAKIAATDRLTDLANRTKLDEVLGEEVKRASRYSTSQFGLILLDIDDFKQINDQYGHDVGDRFLVEFSKILSKNVRSTDTVGRWGGEEFMIISPETTLDGLQRLAEGLRLTIGNHEFPIVGPRTASFGITTFRPGDDADALIKRADVALYQAKGSGRNLVVASN